jgi:hypothetical protein
MHLNGLNLKIDFKAKIDVFKYIPVEYYFHSNINALNEIKNIFRKFL